MSQLDKEYYTTGEAAKIIGVSFRTIKRWIYAGRIRTLNVNNNLNVTILKSNRRMNMLPLRVIMSIMLIFCVYFSIGLLLHVNGRGFNEFFAFLLGFLLTTILYYTIK